MQLKLDDLLEKDKYISKKEYTDIIRSCGNKRSLINNIESKIELHNNQFVARKLEEYKVYFDNIFEKVDKNVLLDNEQRNCVLVDEDYCLVIAGAGAGKTTTLAAKVKYLVEKEGVDPSEIIVISYTRKAVKELYDKIVKQMKIPAKVITFHSLGFEIMKKDLQDIPDVLEYKYKIFSDIITKRLYKDSKMLNDLIYFLACYIDIPEDIIKYENLNEYIEQKKVRDYNTLKHNIEIYNDKMARSMSKYMKTINGEVLRSFQEVMIANFLYINNIDYTYEKTYPFRVYGMSKDYFPDFHIKQADNEAYIEHFGLYSKNKKSKIFTVQELRLYEKNMDKKIQLHKKYGTRLITTYSTYDDGRELLTHLEEELEKEGFVLTKKDPKEIYDKIIENCKDKYVHKLISFLMEFISKFKTLGMDINDFKQLRKRTGNVRTLLFIDLAEYVYIEYEDILKKNNKIDFEDMINSAIKVLEDIKEKNIKLDYKYIIIDEYQDIAKQRFNLTKKLAESTDSKVIAVGDDWQSIFAFAGSSSDYFLKFKELMGYAEELKITHTYRNSQQLIDIAGDFVQKNQRQIKKRLISKKYIENPVCIYSYEDDKNILTNKINLLIKVLDKIVKDYGDNASVLILVRYEFEKHQLLYTGQFEIRYAKDKIRCLKHPNLELTVLTAHRSKGLGYDNVIIMNATNSKFGFPSQIENDPIMNLLEHQDIEPIKFAEERRLFYVALTRTKNRVYILSPTYRPSVFVQELIEDYPVFFDDKISNKKIEIDNRKCPNCEFPLKFMPKRILDRINLWVCTNEPEVCDFMTNDLQVKKDIHYCKECEGYMIIKSRKTDKNKRFFGCTNYNENGLGCNYTEDI